MKIKIKNHKRIPNQKVIVLFDNRKLIATIIPKKDEIAVVSKYIKDVKKDMKYPPKITFIIDLKQLK